MDVWGEWGVRLPGMTDIRLPLGGLKFSVRVALLCVRNGELLVQTSEANAPEPFFFLPGGALSTDEDAATCARREWEEETGLLCGPLRLVAVVENFFGPPEKRQHEIGFYFRLEEVPAELPHGAFSVLDNTDTGFEWVRLDELGARPVYPLLVRDLLSVPVGEVRHLVIRS